MFKAKFFSKALPILIACMLMSAPVLAEDYKIAIVTPGPISDNGWNQAGYEGIKAAEKKLGVKSAYSEQVPQPEHMEVISDYARRGYNLIFAHGGEMESAVFRIAKKFPNVTFAITNGDKSGGNVAMIEHNFNQFGYVLGYLGGKMTKTGKAGYICGEKIKVCTDFESSFPKGFKAARPDGEVFVTYTNEWSNIAKAKQAALLQISQGADILFPVLDQGVIGAFRAAEEKSVWAFGMYYDVIQDYPDVTLQSAILDISKAIVIFTELAMNGKAEGKVYRYGIGSGAARLGTFHPKIPADVRNEVEQIMADLQAGKIQP